MNDALDVADLRSRVQACIDSHLAEQTAVLADLGPDVTDLLDAIAALLRGGKRLRAAFAYWGYRAAGGPDSEAIVRLATSMEFFQGAALIHDDVMDDSDTRRGLPAAHRALALAHTERAWEGSADRFGLAGAVLAGNLCLNWTEDLYAGSGLPAEEAARGRHWFAVMRTQLMGGQFLDVVESVRPWHDLPPEQRLERARRVLTYKSAKYTVEHPLLIGAATGGADAALLDRLSAYGLAVGRAFQLRDDVLGVFGDPQFTGKPAGDDLREGKRTVLIAHTLDASTAPDAHQVERLLGRPDLTPQDIAWLRDQIVASGAVDRVEAEIDRLSSQALAALAEADIADIEASHVLRDLVDLATERAH